MRGRATVRNFRCDVAFRCDRRTHTQAGPLAVTVGLLGELGYVGIEAVRRAPTPPRCFGGGRREPVEIPGKLAEVVRCERNVVRSSESICSSTNWRLTRCARVRATCVYARR